MTERTILDLTADDVAGNAFPLAEQGWYTAEITEVELKQCGPNSKNPGKDYYKLVFKSINEDEYKGNFFTNAMHFKPAHFTIVGIAKALGLVNEAGQFAIPTEDELLGQDIDVFVVKKKEIYEGEEREKNEIKRFRPAGGGDAKATKPKTAATKKKFDL